MGLALEESKEEGTIEKSGEFYFILGDEITKSFNTISIDYSKGLFRKGFKITSDLSGGQC